MPRPSFRVKDSDRKLVHSLAALGLRQEQIAESVGLRSPKTLRKHFRTELDAGLAEATLSVVRVAHEMATSGRYPQMTMFWDKCQRVLNETPEERPKNRERSPSRSPASTLEFVPQREVV
jgi:hypothetical protein